MRSSSAKDGFAISDNGLFLMDVEFDGKDIGDICKLNDSLKRIVGFLDTSLFYNIATKVLVASENGIRIIECER